MAMPCSKVVKKLKKLLEQEGISGYSVEGDKITIFVERMDVAKTISLAMFEGYKVEVVEVGRFEAL
jgi:hypothetical protein